MHLRKRIIGLFVQKMEYALWFLSNTSNKSLAGQIIIHFLREHISVGIFKLLLLQRPILCLQLILDLLIHYILLLSLPYNSSHPQSS